MNKLKEFPHKSSDRSPPRVQVTRKLSSAFRLLPRHSHICFTAAVMIWVRTTVS